MFCEVSSSFSICGNRAVGAELIVGGQNSTVNAWPWAAALFSKTENSFFCPGTLISEKHVITG